MPTLMIRDLHADAGAVRTVTLLWSVFSSTDLLLAGSPAMVRSQGRNHRLDLHLLGFVVTARFGRVNYPGTVLELPLFWGYALWGLRQGSIGVFGFPVELRPTDASTTFTAGRLVGTR